jgi:hypothetical protein
MRPTILTIFLLSHACASPGGKGDDEGGGGLFGGGDDADTDADTDADVGVACPAYSGIVDGRTWTYATTDEYERQTGGAWTMTTTTSLAADGTWTSETSEVVESAQLDDYTLSFVSDGYCDGDGSWVTHNASTYSYSIGGETTDGWSETTYDEPVLSLPAGIDVGSAWTSHLSGVTETDAGQQDFDQESDYEVTGEDTIEIAAGSFDALVISGGDYGWYVDRDVGNLGDADTYELVSTSR